MYIRLAAQAFRNLHTISCEISFTQLLLRNHSCTQLRHTCTYTLTHTYMKHFLQWFVPHAAVVAKIDSMNFISAVATKFKTTRRAAMQLCICTRAPLCAGGMCTKTMRFKCSTWRSNNVNCAQTSPGKAPSIEMSEFTQQRQVDGQSGEESAAVELSQQHRFGMMTPTRPVAYPFACHPVD